MSAENKIYIEYNVRIPKPVDEFLDKVVFELNQKTTDPTKYINKEALIVLVIRDWYASQVLPKIMEKAQIDARDRFAIDLKKAFEQTYK